MKKISYTCTNGLGDKLLDVIGIHVLCHYLELNPKIKFNKDHQEHFDWGSNIYDTRLFEPIEAFTQLENCEYHINSPNPSSSLSPYKVYKYLCDQNKPVVLTDINDKYHEYAKLIKPAEPIRERLPQVLEKAYGIHLRKSDKVKSQGCDIRHENKIDEFTIILENLLKDVEKIIIEEENPVFLVVSEDKAWKKTITEYIFENAKGKHIEFIELDYSNPKEYMNFEGILDMFALSRCKTIMQGVKYSSYSILAALISKNKLINYSHTLESNMECLIYSWNSAVEINGEYIKNIDILSCITKTIQNIEIITL